MTGSGITDDEQTGEVGAVADERTLASAEPVGIPLGFDGLLATLGLGEAMYRWADCPECGGSGVVDIPGDTTDGASRRVQCPSCREEAAARLSPPGRLLGAGRKVELDFAALLGSVEPPPHPHRWQFHDRRGTPQRKTRVGATTDVRAKNLATERRRRKNKAARKARNNR